MDNMLTFAQGNLLNRFESETEGGGSKFTRSRISFAVLEVHLFQTHPFLVELSGLLLEMLYLLRVIFSLSFTSKFFDYNSSSYKSCPSSCCAGLTFP